MTANPLAAGQPGAQEGAGQRGRDPNRPVPVCQPSTLSSPYIPVDSWVYPAMFRLYGLGFVDNVFLGMRPWTRASVSNMLDVVGARIEDADPGPASEEAKDLYEALTHELRSDMQGPCLAHEGNSRIESVYSVMRDITGTPLRDSYHLGSTIINDYGRPYSGGFNNYSGASGYLSAGRFLIYARGEFQGAPSATGYSTTLAQYLTKVDSTDLPQPRHRPAIRPDHHPARPYPHGYEWEVDGGLRLGAGSESRHFLRQTGRMAGTRPGRRHGLLQQR